jgi:hypothetical protein
MAHTVALAADPTQMHLIVQGDSFKSDKCKSRGSMSHTCSGAALHPIRLSASTMLLGSNLLSSLCFKHELKKQKNALVA